MRERIGDGEREMGRVRGDGMGEGARTGCGRERSEIWPGEEQDMAGRGVGQGRERGWDGVEGDGMGSREMGWDQGRWRMGVIKRGHTGRR